MQLADFQAAGQMLQRAGLISGSSGNLSVRVDDNLLITRHGSALSNLISADLVETGIFRNDARTRLASSELPVHREIYRQTGAKAIVHSHAPCAVTLSLTKSAVPDDICVVGQNNGIIPGALAEEIAAALKLKNPVLVRGHGPFAIGRTLVEACHVTLDFESECSRICQVQGLCMRSTQE